MLAVQTISKSRRVAFFRYEDYDSNTKAESIAKLNEFLATHDVESVQMVSGYGYGYDYETINGKDPVIMVVYHEGGTA